MGDSKTGDGFDDVDGVAAAATSGGVRRRRKMLGADGDPFGILNNESEFSIDRQRGNQAVQHPVRRGSVRPDDGEREKRNSEFLQLVLCELLGGSGDQSDDRGVHSRLC